MKIKKNLCIYIRCKFYADADEIHNKINFTFMIYYFQSNLNISIESIFYHKNIIKSSESARVLATKRLKCTKSARVFE